MYGTCTHYILNRAGGGVVHSYGILIPFEFPITDLQQISGPDGIGRITCTVSSGIARFVRPGGVLETGGLSQTRNGATATLVVNPSNVDSFQNRGLYCTNVVTNYFYLFLSNASKYIYIHTVTCKVNCGTTYNQPYSCSLRIMCNNCNNTTLFTLHCKCQSVVHMQIRFRLCVGNENSIVHTYVHGCRGMWL